MKLNKQRLLEHIIEEGIQDALQTRKEGIDDEALIDHIITHIWMGLDFYFDFEEN
jgi:hypothetical protein